eukprot:Gregarina_sp_Poly_1__4439@NODE_2394_length_2187_cov_146_369340_g1523_i0_p3_GENE_NODE_2394_length_2187_cov_146_369340_g1523_i0NODE_2394_length_2187_cov_146_369340_g1523_i0_p3_ORF_typecomplete_len111_score7_40_NODE_2394_length_2187_cov_146_369340_g1523_i0550882
MGSDDAGSLGTNQLLRKTQEKAKRRIEHCSEVPLAILLIDLFIVLECGSLETSYEQKIDVQRTVDDLFNAIICTVGVRQIHATPFVGDNLEMNTVPALLTQFPGRRPGTG